jgi:hypothetical protein
MYALIMAGISDDYLEHFSENAIRLGDFSEHLSCRCTALATGTVNTAAAVATMAKPAIRSTRVRMSLPFLLFLCPGLRHKFRHSMFSSKNRVF